MDDKAKIEAYYDKEHHFKDGLLALRAIVKKTQLEEVLKWGAPIYALYNKNVLGIMAFKNHFGLWFFHGSLLKDHDKVLENAQEGKTKFLRHWKFTQTDEINESLILSYINEAIEVQKNNQIPKIIKKPKMVISELLMKALEEFPLNKEKFSRLSPYKKKEYHEYIISAKQDKTKKSRLQKSLDLISKGIGLNDMYRK